jgi:hypothetical protein
VGTEDVGTKRYAREFGHCGKLKGVSQETKKQLMGEKSPEGIEQPKVTTCPSMKAQNLPTRVIEVESPTEAARLLISEDRTGERAALSHCWGSALSFKTDSTNIGRHYKELRLEDLPATFRDAVVITRGLGFRYEEPGQKFLEYRAYSDLSV